MARIRTVKPEFFRHEQLQELETQHPGKYAMLVFIGLWGHCDSHGRFEWRPRLLKLDILPFLDFDMATTLDLLADANMLTRYAVDGREYGEIPTFKKHQRLSGKEASEGAKCPPPDAGKNGEAPGKNRETNNRGPGKIGKPTTEDREKRGSTGEAVNAQEGKGIGKGIGREHSLSEENERKGESPTSQVDPLPPIPAGFRPWDCDGSIDRLAEELGRIRSAAGFGPAPVQVSRLERGLYSDARCDIQDAGLIAIWRWMWTSNEHRAHFLRKGKFITFKFLLEKFAEYADVSAQPPPPDFIEQLRRRNEAMAAKAAAQ